MGKRWKHLVFDIDQIRIPSCSKPRKKIEYLKINIHQENGQLKSIDNYLSIICISKNVIDVLISKTSKKIHKASNWIIGHRTVLVVNFHRWTPTHFGKYLNPQKHTTKLIDIHWHSMFQIKQTCQLTCNCFAKSEVWQMYFNKEKI